MRVMEVENAEVGKSPARGNLGSGELSAYRVHLQEDPDALITDDRAFLKFLESRGIPFITPANGIVEMENQEQISREEAVKGLDRIKRFIRNEVYEKAIEEVKNEF